MFREMVYFKLLYLFLINFLKSFQGICFYNVILYYIHILTNKFDNLHDYTATNKLRLLNLVLFYWMHSFINYFCYSLFILIPIIFF